MTLKEYISIGDRFGRLVVIRASQKDQGGRPCWFCQCDCGSFVIVRDNNLKTQHTKSCSCLKIDMVTKHGESAWHKNINRSRLYTIWIGIKNRCYSRNVKGYRRYGARGISMCREWKDNYLAFKKWAISNGHKNHLTIDRIDNDGNYEPSNCQWITRSENSKKGSLIRWPHKKGEKK